MLKIDTARSRCRIMPSIAPRALASAAPARGASYWRGNSVHAPRPLSSLSCSNRLRRYSARTTSLRQSWSGERSMAAMTGSVASARSWYSSRAMASSSPGSMPKVASSFRLVPDRGQVSPSRKARTVEASEMLARSAIHCAGCPWVRLRSAAAARLRPASSIFMSGALRKLPGTANVQSGRLRELSRENTPVVTAM